MKKIFLIMFLAGFIFNVKAEITISNPIIESTTATDAEIGGIIFNTKATYIAIKLNPPLGYCISGKVSRNTYITYINPETHLREIKQICGLTDTNGRALIFGKKYTTSWDLKDDVFLLQFPAIPQKVKQFNLIIHENWKWYGIKIGEDVKRIATTENEINQLITSSKNVYSGIYESLLNSNPYRLALIQKGNETYLIYISSTQPIGTWECGELKAILRPTALKSVYKADWYMANKIDIEPTIIKFEETAMEIHFVNDETGNSDCVYIKMGNSPEPEIIPNIEKWTGTGFALKDGHILTNYHVIHNASEINIYGIDGDFCKGYKASIIGTDKVNDLALLKLSEQTTESFNYIPYSFKSQIADVGENVYVLGYPLTATMGEEVKLTNGIISAKTGFDGDVSQYQISVPIQPGNSGGPLIDYNGNIIGVVCAKHIGTENVSYAIKTSQVRNLIESVSDLSLLNTTNTLQGKSLKEQVKSVNKYVYIIKCSK